MVSRRYYKKVLQKKEIEYKKKLSEDSEPEMAQKVGRKVGHRMESKQRLHYQTGSTPTRCTHVPKQSNREKSAF